MSLEEHHRFILEAMARKDAITRNFVNDLEAENARLKADVNELADGLKLASEVGIKMADEVTRLKAEVERLRNLGIKLESMIDPLEKRVERLTKAGDELHAFLINYIVDGRISSAYLNKLDDGWNAAKEGKPRD
jgi:pyridoxine 5'-phosphate synthase PdxJ